MNRRELLALIGTIPAAVKIFPVLRMPITEPDLSQDATIMFTHLIVTADSSRKSFETLDAIALRGSESLVLGVENGELKIDVIKRA